MLSTLRSMSLFAGILAAAGAFAQAPASAPAGSTGLCKDGTYWTGPTKKGACRGHHGVQDWYAAATTASAAPAATAPMPAATPAPAAPAASAAPAAPPAAAPAAAPAAMTKSSAPAATAAPGGGPGLVWANKNSKVYHCPADRWYGKTKNGAYMSEADATSQGYRPDHGKACH